MEYANHPNQLKYNGRSFVSTFAGESCKFGQSSAAQGWASQFTRHPDLTGQNAVCFVPSFFIDPGTFSKYNNVMDGSFNVRTNVTFHFFWDTYSAEQFNSGWPIQITTSFANSLLNRLDASISTSAAYPDSFTQNVLSQFIGSTDTDAEHLNCLAGMPDGANKVYMGAVSPWFFTHYSPQSFNKNVSARFAD